MSFVQIAVEALSQEALEGLIEEFVTRDGTDYGAQEHSLDAKKNAVRQQLELGEVVIVFDTELQSANLLRAQDLEERAANVE